MSRDGKGATSVAPAVLSRAAARKLTDEVKADAQALWTKLTRLYDGGAHKALGYKSWGDYWVAEFGGGKSDGYRLLDAGRVLDALDAHSPIGERPESEGVARELKPLAKKPEDMARAWGEAATEAKQQGAKPTAKQVRQKVKKVQAASRGEAPPPPKAKGAKKRGSVITGRAALSHDPRVIRWVRDRYRDDWTREQIVAASEAKTDGWPLPDASLTNGGVSECRAAIVAIERCEMMAARAVTRENKSRKRMREFWALQDSGDTPLLNEAAKAVAELTSKLSALDLTTYDFGDDEVSLEFDGLYEALVEFQTWLDITITFVEDRVSVERKRAMIRHMRQNTAGMTAHERETSLRLADKLEAKLDGPRKLAAV